MKIRPVGTQLFHADGDGQTDMTKPIIAFRNFASTPKRTRKIQLQRKGVPTAQSCPNLKKTCTALSLIPKHPMSWPISKHLYFYVAFRNQTYGNKTSRMCHCNTARLPSDFTISFGEPSAKLRSTRLLHKQQYWNDIEANIKNGR
jgi:hypothetical protein